jgi:hypothetical protein
MSIFLPAYESCVQPRPTKEAKMANKEWPIDIGRVNYEPGAPKNAPRWMWRCGCIKCRALPLLEGLHGPFKTKRAARHDAVQFLKLMWCDRDSMGTA